MIPQHLLVYDGECRLVDFVGRFEMFQADYDILCNRIELPLQQLPHLNKSTHGHYSEYYDTETKELVGKLYAKDIELFKYKFETGCPTK
jgi:hypothetical protein